MKILRKKMVSKVVTTYWIFIIVVLVTFQTRTVCGHGEEKAQQISMGKRYANETGKYANEATVDTVEEIMDSFSQTFPDEMQYRSTDEDRYRNYTGSFFIEKAKNVFFWF